MTSRDAGAGPAGCVVSWREQLRELAAAPASDAERIDLLRALEELKGAAAAAQARVTAAFAESQRSAAGSRAVDTGDVVQDSGIRARRAVREIQEAATEDRDDGLLRPARWKRSAAESAEDREVHPLPPFAAHARSRL